VIDRENPDIGIGIKGPMNIATPSFVRLHRAARYSAMVVNCIGFNGSIFRIVMSNTKLLLCTHSVEYKSEENLFY